MSLMRYSIGDQRFNLEQDCLWIDESLNDIKPRDKMAENAA